MKNIKDSTGIKYLLLVVITTLLTTSLNAEFIRNNSKNIVSDNTTNLQWQDNEIGFPQHWLKAIDTCERLNLGGYKDWRLPNINELETLVDDKSVNSSISNIFKKIIPNGYWSSTTYVRCVRTKK